MRAVAARYAFDGWTLDAASGELRRGADSLRLQEHSLQVLLALLEAPGEVVTRESLIRRLWPTGVVEFDTGLNTAVRRLRVALGDDADVPRYIETLPRKGYRFIRPLDPAAPASPAAPAASVEPATEAGARRHRRMPAAIAIAAAVVGVGIYTFAARDHGHAPAAPVADRSIAVLPFADLGGASAPDNFAEGATEDIAATLGRFPSLRVIGRASAAHFRGRTDDLRSIGRQLGAAYLVEGSVRRSGSRIRLTAELVDAETGTRLWSSTYDRDIVDLLDTQEQVAASVARSLQLAVSADVVRGLHSARSLEAYELYLRGRAAIDRGDAGILEARADLAQALASEPAYVDAANALVLSYLEEIGGKLTAPSAAWPGAVKAAHAALALDARSMLPHAILGLEYATYEYDWPAAGRELDIIAAAKSRDPDVLYLAAWLAFDLGRHDLALRLQDEALALDPLNPDSLQNAAYIHFLMRDFQSAERDFRRGLAVSPTYSSNHRMLGRIFLQRGQPQAALTEMLAEAPPWQDIGLAMAYAALGRRADSDLALERAVRARAYYGAVNIAIAYGYRGDRDHQVEWLRHAVEERDLNLGHCLKYDPAFDALRGDARYHEILRAVHLEP